MFPNLPWFSLVVLLHAYNPRNIRHCLKTYPWFFLIRFQATSCTEPQTEESAVLFGQALIHILSVKHPAIQLAFSPDSLTCDHQKLPITKEEASKQQKCIIRCWGCGSAHPRQIKDVPLQQLPHCDVLPAAQPSPLVRAAEKHPHSM